MKKLYVGIIFVAAATLIAMMGGPDPFQPVSAHAGTSADKVKKETKEAYEATKNYAVEKKDKYVQKVEKEMKELDNAYDKWSARAKSKAGDLKAKTSGEINAVAENLKEKRKVAEQKLEELKSSGKDAWEGLKSGVDSAVNDLGKSIERAKREF